MRVKLFTFRYSATLGGFDESRLQEFCRDKEVLAFREHFFAVNEVPHLACVLTWQDAAVACADVSAGPSAKPRERKKPDPTADLDESERVRFNTLREWRAAKAREEGVPPYVVFTNRQFVDVIRARPDSASALAGLPGIGPGKTARYGAELLDLLS